MKCKITTLSPIFHYEKGIPMIDFSGKIVLITGGSRGIGKAAALMFARTGAEVLITYAGNSKAAQNTITLVKKSGGSGESFRLRVENPADCRKLITRIIRKYGRIDVLVNNAGIWEEGGLDVLKERDWNRMIEVNLTGTFNMCRAVAPAMKKQHFGRIVNISSTAGQRGEAFHSHYAASKGGVIALTKSLAVELIQDGIRVNCVAPGWVETDMTASAIRNLKDKRAIVKSIPRGDIGKPHEIAGPILFLASDLAEYIVGEILNVNGGSVLCG